MTDKDKTKERAGNERAVMSQCLAKAQTAESGYECSTEGQKRQQEEQQIIFDSIPAMIFYKDKQNRFIRVNKALAETMGMTPEEMKGKSCYEIYPHQAEEYWKDDQEVMASGRPKRNIVEPLETNMGTIWIQTDKIPYRDKSGDIVGIIGFSVDITERKRVEAELNTKLEELEEFNRLAVGREQKIIELKEEINKLLAKLDIEPKYEIVK